MRWRAALLALLAAGAAQAAGPPQVRVEIEAKQPLLVGQEVRVAVQVLAPNFFTSPPAFPAFELPGAVVRLLDDRAENSTETIGGESYAGILKRYAITPQQAGEFTLPPAKITFQYAAEPGKPGVDGAVTLPQRRFTVQLPAGAKTGAAPVPVAKVTLTQTLDREPKGLKAGDTLTRTVEAFAPSTQPMMIPPPVFDAPRGVRVYRHDPVLSDATSDRGDFVGGRRADRVTYAFDAPGDYVLPAVEVAWLNPASGKQEVARAPEIKVAIAPNPGWKPEIAPGAPAPWEAQPASATRTPDWQRWAPLAVGLVAALLVLAGLARRFGPRCRAWAVSRRRERAQSEAAYFARLESACRANDAAAAYRALGAWSRRIGAPSIAAVAQGEAFRAAMASLERSLFGAAPTDASSWNGGPLAAVAGAVRRARAHQSPQRGAGRALPALNP